MASDLSCLD